MFFEYPEYGTDNKYNVIQVLNTFNLKISHQPIDYGNMTTATRYKKSYLINKISFLIFSVALGNNSVLRSVRGIP